MSYLNHCLEQLGFSDIEDVNANTLKKAFKVRVLQAHPDRGGNQKEFDEVLSAYVFLINLEKRIYGGRNEVITEITPDELKENRIDEIIDKIFEEFKLEEFNKEFEAKNQKEVHGYNTWLNDKTEDNNVVNGKYGEATQKPPEFDEKDFNNIFITKVKEGKPEPTAIILHPEAMAYISGSVVGTSIIEKSSGPYTSDTFATPEFCDAYSAFTTENTISDKVSNFVEINKSLDDIIAERESELKPFEDVELDAIRQFEKLKLEANKNNLSNIKNYYELKDGQSMSIENWPPEKYDTKEYSGFRMDF
jgi:curved DNA-binding protein CbpA